MKSFRKVSFPLTHYNSKLLFSGVDEVGLSFLQPLITTSNNSNKNIFLIIIVFIPHIIQLHLVSELSPLLWIG